MSRAAQAEATLTGIVRRFIYRSGDFGIFKLDDTIALGEVPGVSEGDKLTVRGKWETHPKFGRQFRVKSWEKPVPSTKEAAVEFLSSGLIKGVGPATAQTIVDTLGPDAVKKILDGGPGLLKTVKGIGEKKAPEIARQVRETYQVSLAVSELVGMGLSCRVALKAYKEFGRRAAEFVRQNPYCLTKLDLIGFHRADAIARNLGIAPSSPFRTEAALRHTLNEALWTEGHTCLPEGELISRALELLNKEGDYVSPEQAAAVLSRMEGIARNGKVAFSWARRFEEEIARDVKRLAAAKHPKPEALERRYPVPEKENLENLIPGVTLTPDQVHAVRVALSGGISILTGGPGVGKTQTVRAVIEAFRRENPFGSVVLCAPTGRAARRLAELTGHPAHTIHKLIGMREDGAARNKNSPLDCDLLVVDEASMAGIIMAKRLLEAVPDGCRVLLVGDVNQLPSVEPGNVLRDLLDKVPTVRLTKVFRQAAESRIILNAHRINRGEMVLIDRYRDDFVLLEREDPEDVKSCVKTFVERLPYGPMDLQVLSPMRKGPLGTIELNKLLQRNRPGPRVAHGQFAYQVGDKVIHTKNNYLKGVMNGEIGVVEEIREVDGAPVLYVRYNGDVVEYTRDDLDELEPAWVITIHKCVAKDTWIWTSEGMRRIGDIEPGLEPGEVAPFTQEVGTPEGLVPASRVICIGRRPTVKITTRTGLVLEMSLDHRVLVADDLTGEERWVRACDLQKGMRLPVPRGMELGPQQELSTAPFHPGHHPKGHRNKGVRWPDKVDENLAEVLGALVADANYTDREDGRVELCKNGPWRTYIRQKIEKLFNVRCTERKTPGKAARFYFHSKTVREFLQWCGLDYVTASQKTVPRVILSSPPSVQAAFLRGLFSGDGAFTSVVVLSTSSAVLAEQVQLLLLNLGIVSKRYLLRESNDRWSQAWRLEISGWDADRFAEVIGFSNKPKMEALLRSRARKTAGKSLPKTNWDTIPGGRSVALGLREALRRRDGKNYRATRRVKKLLFQVCAGKARLTYHHVDLLLKEVFDLRSLGQPAAQLMRWAEKRWFYDEVVAIEPGEAELYDLTVPGPHCYISNGIISHNCQGSEFRCVIVPVHTSHYVMLYRSLLYTAVTRAREKLILVGTKKALAMAIRNNRPVQRYTALASLL
ncbi:RecD/TraA family predicted helicase [Thermodesulfitimonas autotrophica]|uniref:ATP-dependent RecD2 DNA helicase n=1 Tax=Thermodesulfitimonas autotrophica TaxID=1894989 RepID=A0A3N5AWQ7_9THEO|nr:AAA family ATPase [Thermodesulfitimonas autotrophica]RPF49449.1 RecD/TraA family predicted helicase [Thermodesulfitimonas autotrophica]